MTYSTVWWIAAGIAVAAELATGTFYLLMMALGLAAGAIAALFGWDPATQFIAAAAVGGGGTALLYWRRRALPHALPAQANRDVNLDIGERVPVLAWNPDRTTQVQYRGSVWQARLATGAAASPGTHQVCAVEGNWLVLAPLEVPQFSGARTS